MKCEHCERTQPEGRLKNTVGELKDVYAMARHVGIGGDRITNFLKTAAMCGYVLVRQEPAENPSPMNNCSSKEA
jgi:hypothetical protein